MLARLAARLFSSASVKATTGITGLSADPSARAQLIGLYEQLRSELSVLPADYVYHTRTRSLLDRKLRELMRLDLSDVDIEERWKEGQLEELLEQAHAELSLLSNIKQWKPWQTDSARTDK
jgi:NADH dehydrogenase (ubiquinone) 1 alpha subcomplex subunit 5